jgi:arsenite/tail-anchored protein-transporting ATPase
VNQSLNQLISPDGATKYLFFGGKGGVGKTTVATATAVWFADQGFKTTIVSTDPTVSLSVMFGQEIGGDSRIPIKHVSNLCGLNINPKDAKGVYQRRLNNMMTQVEDTFGKDMTSTPCMEEMATFDQFVTFLDEPDSDVIVFDTAPTGKSLRELAMPFDWAGFVQKQIKEGKELAGLLNMKDDSFEKLEQDKRRYDKALDVLRSRQSTVFTMVLLPERLPIEETQSAIGGLNLLGIPVQALVINQCILPGVIEGNRFLKARAALQARYLAEIEKRFHDRSKTQLPLQDHDVSDVTSLREVGKILYGEKVAVPVK